MPESLINQIHYENDAWKKVIYNIMNENTLLKTRLSQVLKKKTDEKFLEKAEKFQTRFLNLDDEITLLRSQLTGLMSLITEINQKDGNLLIIKRPLMQFRCDVLQAERHLSRLRLQFYAFLYSYFEIAGKQN